MAVQWQMDIPALTQLFFNAGANGLKQIALAGVDVHTIGALLTLGNLVPASIEFRKRLDVCRTEQKRTRSWFYKTVEIGAGTNFLADELLKTRAGENAMALFTAVMPVLAESAYTDTILHLFASNRIDADSTPGVGQLVRLRHSLLPFTDSMGLKNKIMQYHLLFRRHASQDQDPHNAIPGPETMAQLIQAFRRVEMEDGGYKLVYRGLQGAAWTATYACEILRLGVCMVVPSPDGDLQIPISKSLDEAQVVFYISEATNGVIELCKSGSVEEFIRRTSIAATDIEWTIDCDTVNFLSAQLPELPASDTFTAKLSEYVTAKTLDCVASLSGELTYSVNVSRSKEILPLALVTYQDHVLPSVQKRSITILTMLGFSPPALEEFTFKTGGFTTGVQNDMIRESGASTPSYWEVTKEYIGSAWWSDELDRSLLREMQQWDQGTSTTRVEVIRYTRVLQTVKNAVLFASLMAFTDWHISLRRISADFFSALVLRKGGSTVNINGINNLQMIQQFCTSHPLPETLFWSFCQELNGVVLLRHVIMSQNLQEIDGIIIRFAPGRILFGGETCAEIAASPHQPTTKVSALQVSRSKHHPSSLINSIKLLSESHVSGNNIYVDLSASYSSNILQRQSLPQVVKIRAELIAEVISNMLVTLPCSHDYESTLLSLNNNSWGWTEGLFFSGTPSEPIAVERESLDESCEGLRDTTGTITKASVSIYYQTVDGDGLHQWLACHFSSEHYLLCIMQHEACLSCTIAAVGEFVEENPRIHKLDVCIIAGRG